MLFSPNVPQISFGLDGWPPDGVATQDIAPALITSTTSVLSPTVGAGAVNVAPTTIPSTTNVFSPVVALAGVQTIAPSPIASTTNVLAHAITTGPVNITVPLIAPVGGVFAPSLLSTVTITFPTIGTTNNVVPPTVTAGAVNVAPPLIPSVGNVFSPTLSQAIVQNITPQFIQSVNYVPRPVVYRAGDPLPGGAGILPITPFIASMGIMMARGRMSGGGGVREQAAARYAWEDVLPEAPSKPMPPREEDVP